MLKIESKPSVELPDSGKSEERSKLDETIAEFLEASAKKMKETYFKKSIKRT